MWHSPSLTKHVLLMTRANFCYNFCLKRRPLGVSLVNQGDATKKHHPYGWIIPEE